MNCATPSQSTADCRIIANQCVIGSTTYRTETPWHLTDGHGNSTETTAGHVWSVRGHRWEKLFRIPSMAIGGPLVKNPWSPVEIDNFRNDNLVCGTFRCGKKLRKNSMQFCSKVCCNVFRKSNYAIKAVKLYHF